ncbi:MAG: hypothetical protein NT170_00005 [Candidatus Moranbacteria bacterium]|nr:hypothetical protein [Candidatus Moranbacteria bacterium]
MAESTVRSATGRAARTSVETEADSVAVAAKEAGTNRTQKTIPNPGVVFLCKEKTRRSRSDEKDWQYFLGKVSIIIVKLN